MRSRQNKVFTTSHKRLNSAAWRKQVTLSHQIAERDGGWRCVYTGLPLVPAGQEAEYCQVIPLPNGRLQYRIPEGSKYCFFHLDHRIPRCQGGSNDLSNLVLASVSANKARGARPMEEFMNRPIESVLDTPAGHLSAKLNDRDLTAFEIIAGHGNLSRLDEMARYAVRFLAEYIRSGQITDLPDLKDFPADLAPTA